MVDDYSVVGCHGGIPGGYLDIGRCLGKNIRIQDDLVIGKKARHLRHIKNLLE